MVESPDHFCVGEATSERIAAKSKQVPLRGDDYGDTTSEVVELSGKEAPCIGEDIISLTTLLITPARIHPRHHVYLITDTADSKPSSPCFHFAHLGDYATGQVNKKATTGDVVLVRQ
jgi:hypothetical protein